MSLEGDRQAQAVSRAIGVLSPSDSAPYAHAVQAKDLPAAAVVAVVGIIAARRSWASRWEVAQALGCPQRVANAKLRRLVRSGHLRGCASCSDCRGDYEVVA